jgi:hypothetical protein
MFNKFYELVRLCIEKNLGLGVPQLSLGEKAVLVVTADYVSLFLQLQFFFLIQSL